MSDSQARNVQAVLDLEAASDEMRREASGSSMGHAARTVAHEPDLRVVLIVMAPGGRIEEHRSHSAATIHVLRGKVNVGLPDRSEEVAAGRLLLLEGDLPHSVTADEESAFLLSLGRPA